MFKDDRAFKEPAGVILDIYYELASNIGDSR